MSPTRRDLLRLSAGAVVATLTAPAMSALSSPQVDGITAGDLEVWDARFSTSLPAGHIRKAEALCILAHDDVTDGSPDRQYFNLFMDGDLDNTWTVWVTPTWRQQAITGDRDREGIIDCRDLNGSELMCRIWQESHQAPPRILNAVPGGKFMYQLADQEEDWELRQAARKWMKRRGEWSMDPGPHTLDELNDRWWELVLWNHPALDTVSGANAVILAGEWFYLAQLDKVPVNIPGVA